MKANPTIHRHAAYARRPSPAVLLTMLALWLAALPGRAQVSPYTTILRTSLTPLNYWIDPDTNPAVSDLDFITTLAAAKDGTRAVICRVFNKQNGFQVGSPLVLPVSANAGAVDVLASTVFAPGQVMILDAARRVRLVPITFRADYTAVPGSITSLGPLGPNTAGAGTVLGEAPNVALQSNPYLGVGTANGHVVVMTRTSGPTDVTVAPTAIQDLGPLPQVGSFVFGTVSGGYLYWTDPDPQPLTPGLQTAVSARFRDPRSTPLIDFGAQILTRTSDPWTDPEPQPIVTANGTREVATLVVPSAPSFDGTLSVLRISTLSTPLSQVCFSSLTATPLDGSGILYNRAFTFADGLAGRLWTIAGATLTLGTDEAIPRSRSQWVVAQIEAENQGAANIDLPTLAFSVDGADGLIRGGVLSAPRLVDSDGDKNVDLEVRFQSALLNRLLRGVTGDSALVRASWLYTDGSEGTASAELRLLR